MPRYSLVAVGAMVSAILFGCGPPSPTPAPTIGPISVSDAWSNHLAAFYARDLTVIQSDYDSESVLHVFNDGCSPGVLQVYEGDSAIRRFYQGLFETLTEEEVQVPEFTQETSNPSLDDAAIGESFDAANVFWVWQSPDFGIEKAAETLLWKEVGPLPGYPNAIVKIKMQNIVLTQTCPDNPGTSPDAPEYDNASAVALAWTNHLTAFEAQNLVSIKEDYTDSSIVQVWTWGMADGEGYSSYEGTEQIGNMFLALWSDMNAQAVGGSIGLAVPNGFPRIQVDLLSVFLAWNSYSHPKAADTFLFDEDGKILRQTIVVTTAMTQALSGLVVV